MSIKYRLALIVILHHFVFIGLVVSCLLSVVYQPLYVAFIHVILVARVGTTPSNSCILTRLENRYREALSMPQIRGFIKHYYFNWLNRTPQKD